ncbi:two-component system activity regulator YycH, partial [Bacillus haynesii]|uniref:two-component system activity regulator YycH n=1 Tax=Bacillus haynesii TaxID=1925021 RepID=UPI001F0AD5B3
MLNEAVKPQQMFIHENGQHYLLNDTTLYSQLWDDMSRWEVKSLKDISDKFDRQQFKNWLYATIRRDLSTLEARGYLKRVHGGASRLSDIRTEPDMLEKSSKNLHEKRKIAQEAASLLEEGDC